jgi:energy-coupling factor transporter ATP-binding protein EcfA2
METEIKSHYNYEEVIIWLEKKGVEQYGNHFKILKSDHPTIFKLIAYFLNDEPTCFQFNINLNKGILLSGPVGCGKTSLMNLMKYLTPTDHKFSVKPCRDISFEFIQDGYEIIHKYSKNLRLGGGQPVAIRYCFDDLGTENNLKYFGNECNVMAEIILSRYELFTNKKLQTHITTNLSATEIENQYGNRIRSRLRELCNLIAYDRHSTDKRK